ncbi:TlpA disulfide reductase family protein [Haloferula sargassicola]|uniref:Thiol-disulfide oxidoreductase ResA n=1 Tax=Haloferula sargassicola TaxID=490096 RepID=A0ABP9UVI2_9BACT
MKFIPSFLLSAALVAGVAFSEDEKLPDASLSEVQFGSQVNDVALKPSELEGKVVVVEKWGTNCGPCLAFLPELAKIAKRYEKKGLAVVGMEVQQSDKAKINKILKDARVKYPVVAGGSTPVNSKYIPHAQVFGANGKLLWAGNPHDDGFMKSIKAGLKEAKDLPADAAVSVDEEEAPIIASREWTNTDGKTITAEVMRVDGDTVVFRMNEREVPYALAKLSDDDQQAIREAAEE